MDADKPILFFDGECNLCNRIVQFFLKHDKRKILRFASLQSNAGKHAVEQVQRLKRKNIDSVLLYDKGQYYLKADAAIRALMLLGGGWKLSAIMFLIPSFLRNMVYDGVASHRYSWFGKRKECMIPTPELRSRFLE